MDQTILPEALIHAARKMIGELEPIRKVVSVSGLGINCDAIFSFQEIQREGNVFCHTLINVPLVQELLPEQTFATTTTFSFLSNAVRYTVRINPDGRSQGRDLMVAINGHQQVTATDRLEEKLTAVEAFREQTTNFHRRLINLPKGEK